MFLSILWGIILSVSRSVQFFFLTSAKRGIAVRFNILSVQEFEGSTNPSTTELRRISNQLIARYIRIRSTKWKRANCLRVEIYGCKGIQYASTFLGGLIDCQSALQTSQKDINDRIPFTLTFQPHNHAVKSINFKMNPTLVESFRDLH